MGKFAPIAPTASAVLHLCRTNDDCYKLMDMKRRQSGQQWHSRPRPRYTRGCRRFATLRERLRGNTGLTRQTATSAT